MGKDIKDLRELGKSNAVLLQSIQLCLASLDNKMGAFISRYDERVAYGDRVIAERRTEMDVVVKKLDELDRFAWFRNSMNAIRDNILVIIFGGIVLILAGIATGWVQIRKWLMEA